MNIAPAQLPSHLKHPLGQGYVFIGDEPVLMDHWVGLLIKAYTAQPSIHPVEKKTCWIEEADDWRKLARETQQLSLFQTTPLLDARFYKKKLDPEGKVFLEQATNATSPSLFILQAPYLQAKSFAMLNQHKHCHLIEIKPLKGHAFIQFIDTQLQQTKLAYTKDIPRLIANYTEGNLLAATQCINQLTLLSVDSLNATHLETLLSDAAFFPLYALSDACLAGQPERILRILQQLRQTQTEPLLILWWLTKLTRQFYTLLSPLNNRETLQQRYQSLGIWSTQQSFYQQAMKRLSLETITTLFYACKQLDLAVKSNSTLSVWDKVEQMALMFGSSP